MSDDDELTATTADKMKGKVVKEIHKTTDSKGRVFHLVTKKGSVTITSNYPEDEVPKLAAIGVRAYDHITGGRSILDEQDVQNTV